MRQKVHIITMGCSKNIVDSERLMAQLKLGDVEITPSIDDADIAVVNTCGFIGDAKEESIDMIIETVKRKSRGSLKKIYAMGCLTERYREELINEIPEVDAFFGSNELPRVLRTLGVDYKHELLGMRELTTPGHTAYLKISEGCDNPCSFCAIPLMRGVHVSRSPESIVEEVRLLADKGVKELVVIGQDTTYYGLDRGGKRVLGDLLQQVADIEGIEWVRLMYAYPAKFPLDVLDIIANHPKLCKYLDMPVQHASDRVLRSMRRGISRRALFSLIDSIRERVPGIALRTTLIVGYPDEGPEEFEELMKFVEHARFDRLGVFQYSQEEGTSAAPLGDPVSEAEKTKRRDEIMAVQQEISKARNESLVNSRMRVLIDKIDGQGGVGRTEFDAPEVDNEVFVSSGLPLKPGEFYDVEIHDAVEYDLFARV